VNFTSSYASLCLLYSNVEMESTLERETCGVGKYARTAVMFDQSLIHESST
jgi:hypothetical protein